MKKLFFLALGCLTLSLGFTACDDDDDDFAVDNSDVLAPVDFNLQTDLNGYFNGTMGLTAYSGSFTNDGGPFVTEQRSLVLTPNNDNTLDIDFGEFKMNADLFVGNMESLVFEKCAVTQTNDGCTFTGSTIINEIVSDFESELNGKYNKRDNVVSIVVTILSENPTLANAQRLGGNWEIVFDGEYSDTPLAEEVEEEVAPNLIYTGTMNVNVSGSEVPLEDIEIYAYFDENGDFDSFVISELSIEVSGLPISIYNIPISISTFDAEGNFTGSAHVVYESVGIDDYVDIEGTVKDNTISLTSGELSVLGAITLSFTYKGETPTTYYFGDSSIIVDGAETVVSTSIYTTRDENGEVTGVTISKLSIDTGIISILTFTDVEVDDFKLDGDSYTGTASIYYEDMGISATFAVSGTIADDKVTMESDEQTVLDLLTISFSFEGAPMY